MVHLGKHVHGADELEKGLRQNIIIWCRSSKMRLDGKVDRIR